MKSTDQPITIHNGDTIEVAGEKFEVKALHFNHDDPVLIIEAHIAGYIEPDNK